MTNHVEKGVIPKSYFKVRNVEGVFWSSPSSYYTTMSRCFFSLMIMLVRLLPPPAFQTFTLIYLDHLFSTFLEILQFATPIKNLPSRTSSSSSHNQFPPTH